MKETQYQDITNLPYERFLKFGETSLTNAELLAIILRTGTKEKSALDLATDILSSLHAQSGKLIGLHYISIEDLMKIKGIGEVKAVKIKALAELSIRMSNEAKRDAMVFTSPSSIADYYMERFRHYEQEQVFLILLDNKGHLLGEEMITKGTINASLVSPREIFLCAFKYGACSMIMMHNHPSGDPTPSREDENITKKLVECGKLMNIPLIDHLIIGDIRYTSFKELGLI